jgi:hypothetical protein
MLVAGLALLLILPFSSVGAHGPAGGAMCSLFPLEMRLRNPHAVAFVGAADGDTILAGPGAEQPVVEEGHYGRGGSQSIYGQRVRIERLERGAPSALTEATVTNRSAVIVPWDYSASCRRVAWSRSARWLPPSTRGAFVAELRERRHWVGGRPTFDVTPEAAVYPSPWPHRARSPLIDAPMLSADEFLSLYEVLPDWDSLRVTPESAAAPLLRWAQMFPQIAAKQPAAYLLDFVREEVIEALYESRPSPLAGTYRVVFRTPAGDSSVFFARTEPQASSVIREEGSRGKRSDPRSGRRIIGHYLLALVARMTDEFPPRRTGANVPEGFLAIVDSAIAQTDSGAVFAGSVDLEHVAASLVSDPLARRRLTEAARHKAALQTHLFNSGRPLTPGRFLISGSGDARFEMVIDHDGVPALTVRAERISREHLQPQEP